MRRGEEPQGSAEEGRTEIPNRREVDMTKLWTSAILAVLIAAFAARALASWGRVVF
jgi:hypothetical protein